MASVIVVDGNFNQGEPLDGQDFKDSLANGMKVFGREVRENGATLAGLLRAFRLILHYKDGETQPKYPGYQVFAINPPPSSGANNLQIRLTKPEKTRISIKFSTDLSSNNPFFIDTRPDQPIRMNVSLPIFANPDQYLGQLIDIIENDLDDQEERDFLFANTLISRCK